MCPIAAQVIENKRRFSPELIELIELIEQEGAARFLVKIWGEKGWLAALFRSILHRCASGTGVVRLSLLNDRSNINYGNRV